MDIKSHKCGISFMYKLSYLCHCWYKLST